MLRSELLLDVPRERPAVTESGVAWTLNRASHSNRIVFATNAAAITVGVDLTGMTTDDGGVIYQGGNGAFSFSFTPSYAGGVSAAPSIPAGARNFVWWRYNPNGGGAGIPGITFDLKSEDAAGSGPAPSYVVTPVSASAAAGVDEVLATLNIPARKAGDKTTVLAFMSLGVESADNIQMKIIWGSQTIEFETYTGSVQSAPIELHIVHMSATVHVCKAWTVTSGQESSSSAGTFTLNAAAPTTMTVVVNRQTTNTRTATLYAAHADFRNS